MKKKTKNRTKSNTKTTKKNEWLFAAIGIIASEIANIDIYLVRFDPKTGEEKRVNGHSSMELLHKPNGVHSGSELRETIQIHQKLVGNSYYLADGFVGNGKIPKKEGKNHLISKNVTQRVMSFFKILINENSNIKSKVFCIKYVFTNFSIKIQNMNKNKAQVLPSYLFITRCFI